MINELESQDFDFDFLTFKGGREVSESFTLDCTMHSCHTATHEREQDTD
jgi:hypothetical protein